jgi:predicted GNAT family N-acyltransferase
VDTRPLPQSGVEVRRAVEAEMPACLEIRRRVFVAEQGVAEEIEVDGLDSTCTQFLARIDGRPVGAARFRVAGAAAKIERVAVLADHRSAGIGRALMAALEEHARCEGFDRAVLNAQTKVADFYERLGYRREGAVFLEADIPHIRMTKPL